MTPPVSENPELRLKDSKGNPLVIAVIDAHTSHWLSPSEVIQAAAIVPDLSLIHISEPTRRLMASRMPSSA